jgi:L-ascorbate metabolism protein UlaG (beta-lactamase superfamily)
MKIHHLRSATFILHLGPHRFVIDPMLSRQGVLPGFKVFGGGRRANPLVPLPEGAAEALEDATACLITHCQRKHLDHFDPAGAAWLRQRQLPVYAHQRDVQWLRNQGIDAQLFGKADLGLRVEDVPTLHGRGLLGWALGKGTGWFLEYPGEPSLYITGDTVLTNTVERAMRNFQPDVIVAPAGAANFGIGPSILFLLPELVELAKMTSGRVVWNHLEALDHCPTTRKELAQLMASEGLAERTSIPEDGEVLDFGTGLANSS